MSELNDLNETDALNTAVSGYSLDGNIANMSTVDNVFQAFAGLIKRAFNTANFRVRDNTDQTKLLAFNIAAFPTATTRTLVLLADGSLSIASGGTGAPTAAASRTSLGAFGVVRVQGFSASGTYTPHPNMLYCLVELIGGGGGGGGNVGSTSFNITAAGGGGGTYVKRVLSKAQIGASKAVTVGGGGGGGGAGFNQGGTGGTSSLATLAIAPGGVGGEGGSTGFVGIGGSGGGVGTGDFSSRGPRGGSGFIGPSSIVQFAGNGASTQWGQGGTSIINSFGETASGYGSGGAGAYTLNLNNNYGGGAGAPGLVLVTEFCSE